VLHVYDTYKDSHYPVRRARAAAVILAYCCLFRPSEYLYDSGPRPHILLAGQIEFECRAPRWEQGSTNTVYHSLSTVHTVPWRRIVLMRITITSAKNINRRVGARLWFSAQSTGAIHVVRVMYDWACFVPHVDSAPVFSWPSPPGDIPTRTYLWYRDFHDTIRSAAGHFGFDYRQFGCQSLWSGGATQLRAAGADDGLICLMGRWKSLPACLGYQETSTRAHDRMQTLLMTPGLYTNRDLHLQYTLPRFSEVSPTGHNIIT
jgi:hypothetical protein